MKSGERENLMKTNRFLGGKLMVEALEGDVFSLRAHLGKSLILG